MKNALAIRLVALVALASITLGTFIPVSKIPNQPVKLPEETTKAVQKEETTTAPEEESEEAGDGTHTGGGGATTAETTKATYTVSKYTGGALPYLDWATVQNLDPNYFANSVFIGDSVSLKLQMYGGLPGATYLCYGSFGSTNALRGIIKANIWNCINGKRRVYIMLGMNDLNVAGIGGAVSNMQQLCSKIESANPGVLIYIQSMTPITKAKNGTNGRILNNDNIRIYNQSLSSMAAANGWYFVDVASVMYTDDGYLKDEYCSDNSASGMGLHFTSAGCGAWCWYLMYHCYDPAWQVYTLTINCIDRSTGGVLKTVSGEKHAAGDSATIFSPEIPGYTPEQASLTYTFGHGDFTIDAYYKKNPPPPTTTEGPTEPPTETPTEDSTSGTTESTQQTEPTTP